MLELAAMFRFLRQRRQEPGRGDGRPIGTNDEKAEGENITQRLESMPGQNRRLDCGCESRKGVENPRVKHNPDQGRRRQSLDRPEEKPAAEFWLLPGGQAL